MGEDCEVCLYLERVFVEKDVQKEFSHRAIDYNCAGHVRIFRWIHENYNNWQDRLVGAEMIQDRYILCGICLGRISNGVPWVDVLDYKGRPRRRYQLLLQPRNATVDRQGPDHVGALDLQGINFSVAKRWLEKCTTDHGSKCQPRAGLGNVSPAWLIDTKGKCLVSGENIHHFVAISYRWGVSGHENMDPVTFNQMKELGGLVKHARHVTPTIKDAIQAVRAIGERYL